RWFVALASSTVSPSGAEVATDLAAMEPLAPPLLSTTIVWPSVFAASVARVRARMSEVPPAECGTTRVMERSGKAWAAAAPGIQSPAASAAAKAARVRDVVMGSLQCCSKNARPPARTRRSVGAQLQGIGLAFFDGPFQQGRAAVDAVRELAVGQC